MWAEMEPWAVFLLVLAGLFIIALVIGIIITLGIAAIAGAVVLLAFASEQGFVGLVAYVAAWVFLFPVMLVASIIIGFGVTWADNQEEQEERAEWARRAAENERRRLGYDD